MKRKLALLGLVGLLVLAGCAGSGESTETPAGTTSGAAVDSEYTLVEEDRDKEGVYRFVDEEAGVVCYVYRDDANNVAVGGTGGLSCLPINQTEL